jgi:hypothetical protein
MAQYPNSGKLSPNRYKDSDKKPDLVGEIIMDRSALKGLLEEHDGDDITIKLSGWNMNGQYGQWTRLSWNNYKPQPKEGYEQPRQAAPKQNPIPTDDSDVPF